MGNTKDAATGVAVLAACTVANDADRRPAVEDLKKLDAVVIDLQDAGAPFYTYETTVGYFLEAAAKAEIEVDCCSIVRIRLRGRLCRDRFRTRAMRASRIIFRCRCGMG